MQQVISSVTSAQHRRILDAFMARGSLNTFELQDIGICAPAARVKELVDKKGYEIEAKSENVWRGNCFHRGIARYVFHGKKIF
jgi:hypothetical protein